MHELLVAQSSFEPRLEQMSWRIDLKSAARGLDELNQPTAIVEMVLGSPAAATDDRGTSAPRDDCFRGKRG